MLLIAMDLQHTPLYVGYIWFVQRNLSSPNIGAYPMKHIVRAFVAVLVLTGVAATVHTTNASAQTQVSAKMSAIPIPSCPPDDPDACHIVQP